MGDPPDRLKVVCARDRDLARARGTVLRPPSAVKFRQGGWRIFFPSSVSLFDLKARFFVPTRLAQRRRAQALSRLAVAPSLRHAPPLPGHTLTAASTTARLVRSGWRSEGSSLSGADQSRHNLVSGGPEDPNHDAAMRIGSEAPKRRTHSFPRHNSHGTN